MSISVIAGVPGAGKTAVLTAIARDLLEEDKVDVYSNYKIFIKSPRLKFWRKVGDLLKIEKGVILMDEIHIYLNSRFYGKMSVDMQYKLAQHRKEGLHIVGTVQNMARVEITMRELVTNYYECKKIIPIPYFGVVYRIAEFKVDEWNKKENKDRKALRVKYYMGWQRDDEKPLKLPKNIKGAYELYDTLGKIELPEDSNVKGGDTMQSSERG